MPVEAQRRLPFFELTPFLGLDRSFTVVMVELVLLDLRYYLRAPTGEISDDLVQAIRALQADLGREPTGTLLFGEFHEMMRRMARLHPAPVYPPRPAFSDEGETVEALGTWSPFEGGPLDPVKATLVRCRRSEGACLEATSVLREADGRADLRLALERWHVERWDPGRIEARRETGPCALETLRIDRRAGEVSRSRARKPERSCDAVAVEPIDARLGDGVRTAHEHFRRRWEEANAGYSSDFGEGLALPLAVPAPQDAVPAGD